MEGLEGLEGGSPTRELRGEGVLREGHVRRQGATGVRDATVADVHMGRPGSRGAARLDEAALADARPAAAGRVRRARADPPATVLVAQAVGRVGEADAVDHLELVQVPVEAVGEDPEGHAPRVAPGEQLPRPRVERDAAQEGVELLEGDGQSVEDLEVVLPGLDLPFLEARPRLRPSLGRVALRERGTDVLDRERAVEVAEDDEGRVALDPDERRAVGLEPDVVPRRRGPQADARRPDVLRRERGIADGVVRVQHRRVEPRRILRHDALRDLRRERVGHARATRNARDIDRARVLERRAQQHAIAGRERRQIVGEHARAAGRRDRRRERLAFGCGEPRVVGAHHQAVRIVLPQTAVHPRPAEDAPDRAARRRQRRLDAGDRSRRIRIPVWRDVGADPHAVHDAHRRAERTAAAQQERLLAGAAAHGVESATQPRRAPDRGVGRARRECEHEQEVELQVVEAHRDEILEQGDEVRLDLRPARVEHEDLRIRGPVRMQHAAEGRAARAEQPLGLLGEELALAHDAERRGPQTGHEARRADLLRHRREPARKLGVRPTPVPHRALVAVVELDDVDADLVARRRQGLEVASHVVLGDALERVVPAAPARDERSRDARAGAAAVVQRVVLEELGRIHAQGHPHGLELRRGAGRQRGVDAVLDLHLDAGRGATRVQHPEGAAALAHPDETRRSAGRGSDDRHEVRLVPAHAVRGHRADAMVESAQPAPGRERRLTGFIEIARPRERPGLPAVAQRAELLDAVIAPDQTDCERVQVERRGADVARAQVDPGIAAAGLHDGFELEAREHRAAGRERSPRERCDVGRLQRDRAWSSLCRAHSEPDRLDAPRPFVDEEDGGAAHARGSIPADERAGCHAAGSDRVGGAAAPRRRHRDRARTTRGPDAAAAVVRARAARPPGPRGGDPRRLRGGRRGRPHRQHLPHPAALARARRLGGPGGVPHASRRRDRATRRDAGPCGPALHARAP